MVRRMVLVLLAALATAPPALAAPPSNDSPAAPAAFAPFTAVNGRPSELQAVGELAEATADAGVPRCLGASSFGRTVWYLVPPAPTVQDLVVEASGRTLDPIDLAAFVGPDPLLGPPAAGLPNACAGPGDGGASAAETPGSAVALRVPANRPVLVQVGRRGRAGTPEDEQVVLSLAARALPEAPLPPPGDAGLPDAPVVRAAPQQVPLAGATLSGEDPATPPCPSFATVWRRLVPANDTTRRIAVSGGDAATLTVFAGGAPRTAGALDCVDRQERGQLEMLVPVRRKRPLWIRIGTDDPAATPVTLDVDPAGAAKVIDGGPGGFDPTPGGPGGGLPAACDSARIERARVTGAPLAGPPGAYHVERVAIRLRVTGARVCDAHLRLYGPRGLVYAEGRAAVLRGRRTVRLARLRSFVRGRYRLQVTGVSRVGARVPVRTTIRGRLR